MVAVSIMEDNEGRKRNRIAMAVYSIPDIKDYVSDVVFHADGSFDIMFREGKGAPTAIIKEIEKRLRSIHGVRMDGIVPKTVRHNPEDIPYSIIVFLGSLE